jgi:uncharacterized membrane protein (DUF485 family)
MIPMAHSGTHRFVRLSRLMMWLTTLGIVVMWVAVFGIVLFVGLIVLEAYLPDWMRAQIRTQLEASTGIPTTPHGLVLASLVLAIPISVALYGLLAVRRMFAAFARGDVFTAQAARHLQVFAATVLAQAALRPLTAAGLAVLGGANPPEERASTIAFSIDDYLSIHDYFALIAGGVLLAAATVMRDAARIAEENAGFV